MSKVKWLSLTPRKTESDVVAEIIECLTKMNVFHWVDHQPVTRSRRGRYLSSKGVADIIGIVNGYPLAIEVKNKGGKVSAEQSAFLKRFNEEGGIGFVAYSAEDVFKRLRAVRIPS